MSQAGSSSTNHVARMLREPTGLSYTVAAISEREGQPLGPVEASQVVTQNVSHDLAERTAGVGYPVFYVYCEKISNQLKEKFRVFSGQVQMVVEIRVSQDRLEEIERQLGLCVEAVTDVLDLHRGSWGRGMFYAGGYDASFGEIRHGGRNFVQSAKVTFEVDVSLG